MPMTYDVVGHLSFFFVGVIGTLMTSRVISARPGLIALYQVFQTCEMRRMAGTS